MRIPTVAAWCITPTISNILNGRGPNTYSAHGISVAELQQQGIYFLVTHAEVFYRSAAHYGETLHVDTVASASRKTAVTFSHTIREATSQRLIVEGSATLVTVDAKGKVIKRPPQLLSMFQ